MSNSGCVEIPNLKACSYDEEDFRFDLDFLPTMHLMVLRGPSTLKADLFFFSADAEVDDEDFRFFFLPLSS